MEKEYYLIRSKKDNDLYLHTTTQTPPFIITGIYILKQVEMETVVLELKSDAEKLLSTLASDSNSDEVELYPINDYIANRKTPIQK